ncbi:peptide chain release factor N(5)-glutamine methyltransferase [Ignatzschineria sp. RMDPL8A]|uniref:peptide chain release factor N(5)-glutamine methyltransferase n=1 Tax=Ignatzschineria sp. RMDPL8A TaxID=2999236 RepID=UPI0024467573|nr:peptide chain release factor N(5)-glutamine methyltransferase [Ignatzschineria sp. RMDPL8A]MDG9729795.1 peptide chain release factor N(5)-glutamine methyltransferase [Ignatzschineria sp. RMDPL8A]
MESIETLLKKGQIRLAHLPNPKFEAEVILAHLLKVNRAHFIAFPENKVAEETAIIYDDWLDKRASGLPFAYLTGEKEFYGLTLKVTKDTLVPRDDTEIIVDAALDLIPESDHLNSPWNILDLGTGTGAIALTLKKYRPHCPVTAVDYNPDTLLVAKHNAVQNHLDVTFIQSDWFSNVKGRFELIVSNPPYIDPLDHHLQDDGVKHEPIRALAAEDRGLADLKTIIKTAPDFLTQNGWLLLEHGYDQGPFLREYMEVVGYQSVQTLKDYGDNNRVTLGQWTTAV